MKKLPALFLIIPCRYTADIIDNNNKKSHKGHWVILELVEKKINYTWHLLKCMDGFSTIQFNIYEIIFLHYD